MNSIFFSLLSMPLFNAPCLCFSTVSSPEFWRRGSDEYSVGGLLVAEHFLFFHVLRISLHGYEKHIGYITVFITNNNNVIYITITSSIQNHLCTFNPDSAIVVIFNVHFSESSNI